MLCTDGIHSQQHNTYVFCSICTLHTSRSAFVLLLLRVCQQQHSIEMCCVCVCCRLLQPQEASLLVGSPNPANTCLHMIGQIIAATDMRIEQDTPR